MGLNKKTVDDINVKGKRVLVRCDFNVPQDETGAGVLPAAEGKEAQE